MNARAVVLMLLLASGCAPRGPVIDTGNRPPDVGGTIAGTVRASDGDTALVARQVTATDASSGARFMASTASNGGYTIKVPSGTYRLHVELRPGETVVMAPESTQVNVGDVDAGRDFVITVAAR
jgi:hypothetical protein